MTQKSESEEKSNPKNTSLESVAFTQSVKKKQQPLNQKSENKQDERKIDTKKLGLVFYEVAKQQSQVFTEDDKFPVMASSMGVILTLSTATLLNMTQTLVKPELKNKKWFFAFGGFNLLGAGFLFCYGLFHLSRLYMKVPQEKWAEIQKEKNIFDSMSFSDKKKFMLKSQVLQEQNKKQDFIQKQKAKLQEKVEISK